MVLARRLATWQVNCDTHAYDMSRPGTYALIGAASMLDGATRMVISLTVILLETTKNIQYLLPLTTTLMVSKFVGDFFNISIYEMVSSATPYPPCPELRMRTVLTAESVSRLSPST